MECSVGGRPSIKRYFKIRDAFIIPVFLLMCEKGEVLLGKERDYYWGAALLFTSLFFYNAIALVSHLLQNGLRLLFLPFSLERSPPKESAK